MAMLEDLQRAELLQRIDEGVLRLALTLMHECRFAAGETIIYQGDHAESVFLLFEGRVEVVQDCAEGNKHQIADFADGALFGERALLTGEDRTAAVVAKTEVRVAEISRNNFTRLLRLHPQIYDNLCRVLAHRLGNWSLRHQREERENRELLNNLIGWQILPEFDSFPGVSNWAKELNQRLVQLSASQHNVLILGEHGTWKELAARLIHYHCGDHGRPIFYLDCADPPPVLRQQDGQRSHTRDELLMAIAQESALFGHKPDSRVYTSGTRRGFLELAAGGELILENVECLASGVQRRLADYLHNFHFSRCGESEQRHSRVRIIATSDEDILQLAETGDFNRELCIGLKQETVELLPLRERAKDIPVIAKRLLLHLNQKHHKKLGGFDREALNMLTAYDWPLNGQELQQVIDRAVAVANGPRLLVEHIFLNISAPSSEGRCNLLQLPLFRFLFQLETFPAVLRWLTIPLFLSIIAGCLVGTEISVLANNLVWALWWPALLVSVLLGARSWCSYCPLSGIARLLEKLPLKKWEEPLWLRQQGTWLGLGSLLAILLIERFFDLFHRPFATGLLLAALLALTLLFALVFGVRSWCRHLCPLGRMVGFCSRTSLLELRSNNKICHSQCRVDDCIRIKECPMGLHPTAAGSTDDCILCGSCIRHCSHDSICLNLRYPWLGLSERPEVSWGMALFAPAVLAILLWQTGSVTTVWGLWLLPIYLMGLMLLIPERQERLAVQLKSAGIAFLPLAVAALFALFFRQSLYHGPGLLQPLFDLLSPQAVSTPVDLRILVIVPLSVFIGAAYVAWRIFLLRGGKLTRWSQKIAAVGILILFLLAPLLGH
jgi:transcriptional regulator with AAA-type ATPase domain/NAD-dependent dihydropyrimidine dehydrogenase PreA subunit